MALVVIDAAQETTSTTGTGTLTLTGAVSQCRSFAGVGNGNTTYYRIISGNDIEVGIGTYTSSGTTLSRDTVLYSSAGGTTKITVASGAKVICTYPAEVSVYASNNSAQTSGQILTSNGTATAPTWQNSSKYLSVLLNAGTTTSVPTTNGYLDVLLQSGSHTSVPVN